IAGPNSRRLLGELCGDIDLATEAFPFMSWRDGTVAGLPARVYRVSFSGEIAYEINVPASYGTALWRALMTAGVKYEITPYGTEAMHVLRGEKGFIVVGHDTDGTLTPFDLGMGWIVSKKKKDFLGKRSLARSDCLREGRKQLVGLLSEDPNEVVPEGSQIVAEVRAKPPMPMEGHVTSSYWSPILGRSIAMAVLKGGHGRHGETVTISLANKNVRAVVGKPIFYDPEGEKLRG
ncbi:MAG: sarcosine oxidase subunit alpha, partial [Planctomycetes bacterium]|nr:sarcosine oxidase subunit alpha [Planctomycetota bacterium]